MQVELQKRNMQTCPMVELYIYYSMNKQYEEGV